MKQLLSCLITGDIIEFEEPIEDCTKFRVGVADNKAALFFYSPSTSKNDVRLNCDVMSILNNNEFKILFNRNLDAFAKIKGK